MIESNSTLVLAVPGPGLLFGLLLVAAIAGGHAAKIVHLPRVVGFLVGGSLLHVILTAALETGQSQSGADDMAQSAAALKPIKDLALGLILFSIGGMFERSKLRAVAATVLKISLLEIVSVLIAVVGICTLTAILTQPQFTVAENVVLAVLLATAAVATAPAATMFVLREYQAKGPVTDTVLGLTAINNIVCIVLFQAAFLILAWVGVIPTTGSLSHHIGLALLCSTIGSVVLGVASGTLIAVLHSKFPLSETLLFFFALFIVLGAGEDWLWSHYGVSYNFLLTTLVIGGTFANVALDSQKLESALSTFGSPIFAGFFVLAGFQLHLDDLRHMGLLGAGYIAARMLGKWAGCKFGVAWAHGPARVDARLGGALFCQAAVVIGLVGFVGQYWDHELAERFSSVVLGSVVVFELLGPLLVKRCAVQAGEVKAITLLTRWDEDAESDSTVRRTVDALWRVLGFQRRANNNELKSMCAKHIMRTNVQFIPASATFDEVLHAIERSTHSHFPVVHDDGELAGVIHFNDVHDVIYDPSLASLVTAVDIADADSAMVPMDIPLGELLDLFTNHEVAVLPVVEEKGSRRIVGMVEQRDLLGALHASRDTA